MQTQRMNSNKHYIYIHGLLEFYTNIDAALSDARRLISQSSGCLVKVKIVFLFFEQRATKGDWDENVSAQYYVILQMSWSPC
jgi:hypothetical protein